MQLPWTIEGRGARWGNIPHFPIQASLNDVGGQHIHAGWTSPSHLTNATLANGQASMGQDLIPNQQSTIFMDNLHYNYIASESGSSYIKQPNATLLQSWYPPDPIRQSDSLSYDHQNIQTSCYGGEHIPYPIMEANFHLNSDGDPFLD